jgi:hypothetical protein
MPKSMEELFDLPPYFRQELLPTVVPDKPDTNPNATALLSFFDDGEDDDPEEDEFPVYHRRVPRWGAYLYSLLMLAVSFLVLRLFRGGSWK